MANTLTLGVAKAGRHAPTLTIGSGHLLITGTTNAGKSSYINSVVGAAAACPDVQIIGCDCKMVELSGWAPRLSALARTPVQVAEILDVVNELLTERIAFAGRHGWKSWQTSAEHPDILLAIDELAEAVEIPSVLDNLYRIGRMGRFVGLCIAAATQQANAKVLGDTALRALFTRRAALFDPEGTSYTMALGGSAKKHENLLVNLSMARPGVAVWVDPSVRDLPWLVRAFYWTDADIAYQAAMTSRLSQPLHKMIGLAA